MAKIWKVVAAVVAIALLLAVVFVLVGKITGGDTQRIMNLFNASHDLDAIKQQIQNAIQNSLGMQPLA